MTFFSRTSRPGRMFAPVGSHLVDVYERRVQDDGSVELCVSGQKNIYLEIQEGVSGLTPYEILDRYARCPDENLLKQQEKTYADFTACPRSLAELEQFRIDSRDAFYNLPLDVRERFGNNFQVFMQNPAAFEEFFRGFTERGKKEAQQAAVAGTTSSAAPGGVGAVGGITIDPSAGGK